MKVRRRMVIFTLVALMIAWCVEEESLEVEYCRFTWKKRKVSQ